jgi:hypothetical protein
MNEGILRREGEILLGVSRRIKDERELLYEKFMSSSLEKKNKLKRKEVVGIWCIVGI